MSALISRIAYMSKYDKISNTDTDWDPPLIG